MVYFDVLTVPPDTINRSQFAPSTNPCAPSTPQTYPKVLIFNADSREGRLKRPDPGIDHAYLTRQQNARTLSHMLVHGRNEVIALSARCEVVQLDEANGWQVDGWHMDDSDVDAAVAIYAAVLGGGATDPVTTLLAEAGMDLSALLNDEERSKDDITRSDLTELTAAGSLVAVPGCDIDLMHLPNVPKMSRRKSDSGVDIFVAVLRDDTDADDLHSDEHLTIASVKHSADRVSAGAMRWKLADSLSNRELSAAYLAAQLRVLNARMQQEGLARDPAARIYLFLRNFPDREAVTLFAVGVVAPDLEADLAHHVQLLPEVDDSNRTFRMIFMPGLRDIHERCP